jgi:ABC-type sugar transport system substrate-binding protein
MRKLVIPMVAVVLVSLIVFAGCSAPAPAPTTPTAPTTPAPASALRVADVPELQNLVSQGSLDPNLLMNPYEDLALKPDGTPFRVTITSACVIDEWCTDALGILESLVSRSGAEVSVVTNDWDMELQVSQIEDIVAAKSADFCIILPCDERMLKSSVERAMQAGIPFFNYCTYMPDLPSMPKSMNDYASTSGDYCVGKYFADLVNETGEPMTIFEVWGIRAMDTAQKRDQGFRLGIADNPLITIIESADTQWATDPMVNEVIDALTAHPEITGIWNMGGSGQAVVGGITAAGRLLPLDDPNRVHAILQDTDSPAVKAVEDGAVDGFTTSEPWHQCDIIVKCLLLNGVLGQSLPTDWFPSPMVVVTKENLYTEKLFGATYIYPLMPDDYDLWPVMDTTKGLIDGNTYEEIPGGLPTPTVEMRK